MHTPLQMAPQGTNPTAAPDVHSPPKCFSIAADLCRALLFSAMNMGAYAIRPYTDVRQWPLTFVRPRNVFRLRRMPVGRYCFLPGTWGAYAFAPLHERPTAAPDVHPPPECFPIRAPDAHSPLSETILWADDTHSPLKCFPMGAADAWAPLSECPTGAAGT